MDKDRKKNRNRSNLTTAAIQYPDEFWFEACGGGHWFNCVLQGIQTQTSPLRSMYWLEISPMGTTQPLQWHLNSTDVNGKAPICSEGARSSSWQEALRNSEIPKNGNMIGRNYLNKGNLFLPNTSQDYLFFHGSSLGFVGCMQAALNWFFSSLRANICWWHQARADWQAGYHSRQPGLLQEHRVPGALGELLECNQKTNELWRNKVKFGKVCICPRNAVWAIGSLQPPTGSSAVWFRCSAKASHHWPDSLGEYLQKTNQIIN